MTVTVQPVRIFFSIQLLLWCFTSYTRFNTNVLWCIHTHWDRTGWAALVTQCVYACIEIHRVTIPSQHGVCANAQLETSCMDIDILYVTYYRFSRYVCKQNRVQNIVYYSCTFITTTCVSQTT